MGHVFFACGIHGNLQIGERAASKLLELDPRDSAICFACKYVQGSWYVGGGTEWSV